MGGTCLLVYMCQEFFGREFEVNVVDNKQHLKRGNRKYRNASQAVKVRLFLDVCAHVHVDDTVL